MFPVVTKKAVHGAQPQEPGSILKQAAHGQIFEPLLVAVVLEAVPLSQNDLRCQAANAEKRNPRPESVTH